MGPQEIAQILGVSTKRVYQLRGKPNFPATRWHLATGPLWEREDIEEYAKIPRTNGWPAGRPRRESISA